MALVMRMTGCLGIPFIIHPTSVLVRRILTTILTTRTPKDDGKSRSEAFQDLRWDLESRHWRQPWEKERSGNDYRYEFRTASWTIPYFRHRLMQQDLRIWDRILIIGYPLVCIRALGRWTRDISNPRCGRSSTNRRNKFGPHNTR